MEPPGELIPPTPADPQRIGRYTLRRELGRGGMGVVYLAEDHNGQQVALKVIRFDNAGDRKFRHLFGREVRSAQKVAGFCTARVLDADVGAEQPYVVTEYVDGPTLSSTVEEDGPLQPAELHQLALAVAVALIAIHRVGLVHCDLKPSNVLLSRFGPRVIDFGVAHAVDATTASTFPRPMGTPAFMAPEQILQDSNITSAADIYAWGGVVAYAATGRHPHGSGTLEAILYKVVHKEPDLKGLSPELRPLVTAAMHKNPAKRPSAQDLLSRLLAQTQERAQDVLALARVLGPDQDPDEVVRVLFDEQPEPPLAGHVPWWRRGVGVAVGGLVLVIALIAGILVSLGVADPGPQPGAKPTYRIGFEGPQSGEHERLGRRALNGARAAVDLANRDPDLPFTLEIERADDQGIAAMGPAAARKLINDHGVVAVIGPTFSGPARETMFLYRDARLVTVSPSATAPELTSLGSDTFFRVVPPDTAQGRDAAEYIALVLKARRVLLVFDDSNPYGRGLAGELGRQFPEVQRQYGLNGTITSVGVDPDADFAAALSDTASYDLVYYAGYAAEFAKLVKLLRSRGFNGVVMSGDGSNSELLLERAGAKNVEGVYLTCPCRDVTQISPEPAQVRLFREAFDRVGGGPVDFFAAEAFDAVNVVIQVLRQLHGNVTRNSVADKFQSGDFIEKFEYQGLTKKINFSANGDVNTRDIFLYRIIKGKLEFLGNIAELVRQSNRPAPTPARS